MTCISRQGGIFTGFSKETLTFLKDLKLNNNKVWFEAHKDDYKRYLLEPLQNLATDLSLTMLSIDPYFETTPAVNKTISRIYKDTRFSKDKSPYKTAMWVTFKRPNKEWQDAPAYYFEISADSYRYGMGFYAAGKDMMDKLRAIIDKKPGDFKKEISFLSNQDTFVVEGEKYKKILNKDISKELQEWYQWKSFYLVCNRKADSRLFDRRLLDYLVNGFNLTASFYQYLWKVKLTG